MKDEKISKNIMIPAALIFLIWGIFSVFNMAGIAFGATLIALGFYILIRALHLEEPAIMIGKDIANALRTGQYILASSILIAIGLVCFAIFQAYNYSIYADDAPAFPANVLVFLYYSFIYFLSAGVLYVFGKTTDTYLHTGEFRRSSISIFLAALSTWFIFSAVIYIFLYYVKEIVTDFDFATFLVNIAAGGLFGFLAIEVYYYAKQHFSEPTVTARS
jgi:uncharacterized membrane protein